MNESYISKIFKIGTAGFIKEDGSFLYADENEDSYHGGFEEEILDKNYPEFSNTHPEDDTCIRLFKEPNEIQYKKLEEVIDTYLDFEQYCKIEIWNKRKYDFYKIYSLIQGACEDNSWEEQIGNWTGYKLIQIIKSYFNNSLQEEIVKKGNKWQVQSEKGRNMGTYDTKKEAERRLGQVEYFKHINEGVEKIIAYHASPKKFNTFDISRVNSGTNDGGSYGPGLYFIDNPNIAKSFGNDKGYLYKVELNFKHAYICNNDKERDDLSKLIHSSYNNGRNSNDMKDFFDKGFDSVISNNEHWDTDRGNIIASQYVAFKNDQINILEVIEYGEEKTQIKSIEESFKKINESTRSTLIAKSKSADKYANGKGSRWTQKSKCSVANTVKDYNKIDMNTFWKEDKLTFGVKVEGETNNYIVTISFKDILPKIQRKITDNKELLEFKCIYDALIQAINSGDVKISCTCPDYNYRLKYWNSQNGDEAGEKETRASDKTNPENSKGPACKHILAVLNNVEWLNKIASVINNYANYCKDNMQYNYSKFIFPKLYGIPYNKAVQMSLEDYDENGEIKDTLGSEEALINLSNALGKDRGKFKKGSNKNMASKKNQQEK